MIQFSDFTNADGSTDWRAYELARVRAGEKCRKCGNFIIFPKGVPADCGDCSRAATSKEELSHDRFIRCPKCRSTFDPRDCEMYEVFQPEEHDVTCQQCDHTFKMSTRVTYTFVSPEIIE